MIIVEAFDGQFIDAKPLFVRVIDFRSYVVKWNLPSLLRVKENRKGTILQLATSVPDDYGLEYSLTILPPVKDGQEVFKVNRKGGYAARVRAINVDGSQDRLFIFSRAVRYPVCL